MKKVMASALAAVLILGLLAGCTKVPGASVPSGETEQVSSASGENGTSEQTQEASSGEETESSAEVSTESAETADGEFDYDSVDDYMTTVDGVYSIAYVTDGGAMRDGGRNQNAWEGVKRFASENGKSYKCYQTYGREKASDDDRYDAMKEAIRGGVELVVCAGAEQEQALRRIAQENPEVWFLFLSGYTVKDFNGNLLTNVVPVSFREEQIGYLVGYCAVREGLTDMGFLGSETENSNLIGYGFLQGAEAAAREMEDYVDVKFHREKRAEDNEQLRKLLETWYTDGTELIFTCGTVLHHCAAEEARDTQASVISSEMESASPETLLRVSRNLRDAARDACDAFYNGGWEEISGGIKLGVESDAVGLMAEPWNLKKVSVEDYRALLAQLRDGTVEVLSDGADSFSADSFENVTLHLS